MDDGLPAVCITLNSVSLGNDCTRINISGHFKAMGESNILFWNWGFCAALFWTSLSVQERTGLEKLGKVWVLRGEVVRMCLLLTWHRSEDRCFYLVLVDFFGTRVNSYVPVLLNPVVSLFLFVFWKRQLRESSSGDFVWGFNVRFNFSVVLVFCCQLVLNFSVLFWYQFLNLV